MHWKAVRDRGSPVSKRGIGVCRRTLFGPHKLSDKQEPECCVTPAWTHQRQLIPPNEKGLRKCQCQCLRHHHAVARKHFSCIFSMIHLRPVERPGVVSWSPRMKKKNCISERRARGHCLRHFVLIPWEPKACQRNRFEVKYCLVF